MSNESVEGDACVSPSLPTAKIELGVFARLDCLSTLAIVIRHIRVQLEDRSLFSRDREQRLRRVQSESSIPRRSTLLDQVLNEEEEEERVHCRSTG